METIAGTQERTLTHGESREILSQRPLVERRYRNKPELESEMNCEISRPGSYSLHFKMRSPVILTLASYIRKNSPD